MMTKTMPRRKSVTPGFLTVWIISLLYGTALAESGHSDAYQTGIDAYTYLYPLITMDVTRRKYGQTLAEKEPFNNFEHRREYPGADHRLVVRPNFDTLYSIAWLDLTDGPVIVSALDTNGRYFLLPMMDMWTNVFAVPGSRTTGTKGGKFAVVAQGWRGELPQDAIRIEAPTPYVWIIGRTQTNGPADYAAVNKVQDGYRVRPLSGLARMSHPSPNIDIPALDPDSSPLMQVISMAPMDYFRYGFELMKLHPPQIVDQPMVARLRQLGMIAGESLVVEDLDETVRGDFERGAVDGLKRMRAKAVTTGQPVNGWFMNTNTMGVYGTYYLKRAVVAMVGLGALLPEDAVYPRAVFDADDQPFDGKYRYVLHIEKSELPPVDAFWSLTMYDADGFPVGNPINRFAIGDRDELQYNPDGSLDIYIQHTDPGDGKTVNWLPSPREGRLGMTMRLYGPTRAVIDGEWAPPPINRVK